MDMVSTTEGWRGWRKLALRVRALVAILGALMRGGQSVGSVSVYGRPQFRNAILSALAGLRDADFPAWAEVTRHVGFIFEGWKTTIIINSNPAYIFIDRRSEREGLAYLAG